MESFATIATSEQGLRDILPPTLEPNAHTASRKSILGEKLTTNNDIIEKHEYDSATSNPDSLHCYCGFVYPNVRRLWEHIERERLLAELRKEPIEEVYCALHQCDMKIVSFPNAVKGWYRCTKGDHDLVIHLNETLYSSEVKSQ